MAGAGRQRGGETPKPQVTAPPVLPGTKKAPEAALPSTSPADMTPTDALFDAINRGDLAGAREAANRGADINGQNLIGLTPLELSVDLGRNDISFMLLSLRDGDSASRTMARRGTGGTERAESVFPAGAPLRSSRRARVTAVSDPAPGEPAAQLPRVAAGNGGAPIPEAGFLGFDERRTTH
jgi:hypothetical protein